MTERLTTVWTEIPVKDLDRGIAFYSTVFDWTMSREEAGPNAVANFSSDMGGVHGHLYPGRPAEAGAGPTIHIAVPDTLAAASDRLKSAGGRMVAGPISIPVGSFLYCEDPDGNSIGLFEATAA
ncbi:glyoxalase family protein [Pseudooceanicola batsensis HTCC2597]|uniref:Glyoxalase family protein n=1 Tax=Pseudooceanicola batsensis (strain ATCC BAA-863 / DSM 15984 / KCTC 12145 / HTCC2597) TaxID=252305 RepID=A3TW26_PSEBH|nr:VOC family protein [Pseudooceanicola batsensis]EAQ03822.1 glyoxalase family protein [Pseudooceanicola batsensis HTCC2597]